MLKSDFGMVYQAEGHMYLLVPEFSCGLQKIRVSGCGIYSQKKVYLGFWDRFNMPRPLITAMTMWVHEHRAVEIAKRRNALAQQSVINAINGEVKRFPWSD